MSDLIPDKVFCGRCKEDFPLAPEGQRIQMGYNYPIKRFGIKIRRWFNSHYRGFHYLCGNCYFDVTDEMEEREA